MNENIPLPIHGGKLVCDPVTKRIEVWLDCLPNATQPALVFNQSAFAGHDGTAEGAKSSIIQHSTFMSLLPQIITVKAGVFNLCHPDPASAKTALDTLMVLSPNLMHRAANLAAQTTMTGRHSEN